MLLGKEKTALTLAWGTSPAPVTGSHWELAADAALELHIPKGTRVFPSLATQVWLCKALPGHPQVFLPAECCLLLWKGSAHSHGLVLSKPRGCCFVFDTGHFIQVFLGTNIMWERLEIPLAQGHGQGQLSEGQ